jgi:hypothetical protein
MKILNLLLLAVLFSGTVFAQNSKTAKKEIEQCITNFSSAVDNRNSESLEPLLNEKFRVVANRFPTDDKTTVLNKETYISLLKVGKIGGEKREVKIKSIDITNHIATAKVEFLSDKSTFTTYQTFILNQQNKWQVLSDMPYVKKK